MTTQQAYAANWSEWQIRHTMPAGGVPWLSQDMRFSAWQATLPPLPPLPVIDTPAVERDLVSLERYQRECRPPGHYPEPWRVPWAKVGANVAGALLVVLFYAALIGLCLVGALEMGVSV